MAIATAPHDVIAVTDGDCVLEPAWLERLAARGRARAERFTWDETARLTLEVYEAVRGTK